MQAKCKSTKTVNKITPKTMLDGILDKKAGSPRISKLKISSFYHKFLVTNLFDFNINI